MSYTITSSLPDPKGSIAGTYSTKNFTKDQWAITRRSANETVYTATGANLGVPCTIRISREGVSNVYANISEKINANNQLPNRNGTQVLCQINDMLTYTPDSTSECCDSVKYAPIKCNLVFRVPNDAGITPAVLVSHLQGLLNSLIGAVTAQEGNTMLNWLKGSTGLPFDQ